MFNHELQRLEGVWTGTEQVTDGALHYNSSGRLVFQTIFDGRFLLCDYMQTAPERPTVAVTGDGGFAQYMAELTTAVKHEMNITHVLLNNGQLGKISKEQRAGEWEVWQTSLHNPDFSAYARNCGALGIRVTERDQLDDALAEAVAHDGPAMVEVMADPNLV